MPTFSSSSCCRPLRGLYIESSKTTRQWKRLSSGACCWRAEQQSCISFRPWLWLPTVCYCGKRQWGYWLWEWTGGDSWRCRLWSKWVSLPPEWEEECNSDWLEPSVPVTKSKSALVKTLCLNCCTVWCNFQRKSRTRLKQKSHLVPQVDLTFLLLQQNESVTYLIVARGGCQVVRLRRRSGRCRTETNETYQMPTHSLSVNVPPLPWRAEAARTDCVKLWRLCWHASVWLYSGRPISMFHICKAGLSEGVEDARLRRTGVPLHRRIY